MYIRRGNVGFGLIGFMCLSMKQSIIYRFSDIPGHEVEMNSQWSIIVRLL